MNEKKQYDLDYSRVKTRHPTLALEEGLQRSRCGEIGSPEG